MYQNYLFFPTDRSVRINHENYGLLKLPGRDGSWMGDYATCGSCHLAHAA